MQSMEEYPMKPKLELAKFDGETKQSVAWINKVEELFCIHKISSNDGKVKCVSMKLKGQVYNWYMWWKKTTKICAYSWGTFKNEFFKRFEDVTEKDFLTKITRLQQKGDMEEYTYEWEALVTWVPELTDVHHLQTYASSIKPYIREALE